jgi:hypothetical protein
MLCQKDSTRRKISLIPCTCDFTNILPRYGRILEAIDARKSKTAIRILQWIACSFRILKAHEIQDGIVLQKPGSVLNEDSKLVDGFWEQCKPLIEKGPKNTIDFVHYSAKE